MTYSNQGKRVFDLLVSLMLVIAFLPLFLLSVLFILLSGHSPFFFQSRPGKHGKPFMLLKLRSLREGTENPFPFGKLLRKTSIDELPQLINVLKGDMSLIGPRPLLFEYDKSFPDLMSKRQHVLPGITGLAQVSGRKGLSLNEKVLLDNYYVDQLSFSLDLHILRKTLLQIFKFGEADESGRVLTSVE